jgi:hypothetical protein
LTERALIKSHFFFNNNKGEKVTSYGDIYDQKTRTTSKGTIVSNVDVVYGLQAHWRLITRNAGLGDILCGIYRELLAEIALNEISDEIYWKTIDNNSIRFEDIANRMRRNVYTLEDGKRVVKSTKTPQLPKRNKMFLNSELDLISKVLGIYWDLDSSLKKEFFFILSVFWIPLSRG